MTARWLSTLCRCITLLNAIACAIVPFAYRLIGHDGVVRQLAPLLNLSHRTVGDARSDAAQFLADIVSGTLFALLAVALTTVAMRGSSRRAGTSAEFVVLCAGGLLLAHAIAAFHLSSIECLWFGLALSIVLAAPLAALRGSAGSSAAAAVSAIVGQRRHSWLSSMAGVVLGAYCVCGTLLGLAVTAQVAWTGRAAPLFRTLEWFVSRDVMAVFDPTADVNGVVLWLVLTYLCSLVLPVLAFVLPTALRLPLGVRDRMDAHAMVVVYEAGVVVAFCLSFERLHSKPILADFFRGLVAQTMLALIVATLGWWSSMPAWQKQPTSDRGKR
jgi:hypothetical protein